jgi:hypothetical protein
MKHEEPQQRHEGLEKASQYLVEHHDSARRFYVRNYLAIKDKVIISNKNDRIILFTDMQKRFPNEYIPIISLELALNPQTPDLILAR